MDTVAYVNVYDELIESIVRTVRVVPWQVCTELIIYNKNSQGCTMGCEY